jgi:predicted 2-oxoglutarate/Fe(II)-dependent dioxygenase YbiX
MARIVKEEIAPGIVVYSDVIPGSENLHIDIEKGIVLSNLKWVLAEVKEDFDAMVNTNTRDTQTIGVPYLGKTKNISSVNDASESFLTSLNNKFFENFDPIEKDYMSLYAIFSEWHDTYGILKYGQGQKFTNHIDDHPAYHRRISTVYYLNDNYTGGEINFPRFGITLKPKANQMIIFPSTYVYNHSVSPVIEGERYAVVSWMR